MSSMDNVKKRIIISMCAIILLLITLFGITYAYFSAKVQGNKEDSSIKVTAGSLKLEYDGEDSYIEVVGLKPGTTIESKKFSVKNTGKNTVDNYDVILENVVNELDTYEDLTYELECTSSDGIECNGNSGVFPKGQEVLTTNTIDSGVTHSYILTLTYAETYTNQSYDMNKEISARVNIKDNLSNIKKFKIYGNSIQEGTPTPDNLVEILSVGDKTVNLFNIDEYDNYIDISEYSIGDVLTISTKDEFYFKIASSSGSGLTDGAVQFKGDSYTFEMTETFKNIGKLYIITSKTWGPETKDNLKKQNVQLEKGSIRTSYEPYGKYKIPIKVNDKLVDNIYLDEPLRKVGNYSDYIDYENSKVVRNIHYNEINNTSIFGKSSSSTENFNYYFVNFDNAKVGNEVPIMSNIGGGTFKEFNLKNKYGVFTNQNITYFIALSNITSLEAAKEFVTNNNVYANYVLDKPSEEIIDLLEFQINENDTITLGTSVEPSNIEVEFDK